VPRTPADRAGRGAPLDPKALSAAHLGAGHRWSTCGWRGLGVRRLDVRVIGRARSVGGEEQYCEECAGGGDAGCDVVAVWKPWKKADVAALWT
jgi:hypothetical protein